MDYRTALPAGTELPFPGMRCRIHRCAGRGSNAMVYEASYPDATNRNREHHILVKELFPYDPQGRIRRGADGKIRRTADAETLWQTHLNSFESGNDIHLQLLALRPGRIGGNRNTFSLNGTLYTLLDDTGSRSLREALGDRPARDLRQAADWSLQLLDCLEILHGQGYLHLDINLDNVLLSGDGEQERVLLIDYNTVQPMTDIRDKGIFFSNTWEGFAAPELQTGLYAEISCGTDLFSVAAVFYAALTGRPPTLLQLNRKTPPDAQDSPLLADAAPEVRAAVRTILRRGLCTLPERRYASCENMRQDLKELLILLGKTEGSRTDHGEGTGKGKVPPKRLPDSTKTEGRRRGEIPRPGRRIKRILIAAAGILAAACAVCVLRWAYPGLFGTALKLPAPDRAVLEAAATRAYDPSDPAYDHLMDTLQAAKSGDAWQEYGMGILYEDGTGVERDDGVAMQYYLLAASHDVAHAYLRIGVFYQHGFGVERSETMAEACYLKAAEMGLTEAMVSLGDLYNDENSGLYNPDAAQRWYRQADEGGENPGPDSPDAAEAVQTVPETK